MSLFGMDPNTIQQSRTDGAVNQAARMNADFAVGNAAGSVMGRGFNSLFGLQTPDMQQAQQVQDSMAGQDLTTAAGMRAAASDLMANGQYAQAMALHAKATEMEAEELDSYNAAEDREFGVLTDVKVMTDKVDLQTQKPIYETIKVRLTPDGKAIDVLTGNDLSSKVVEEVKGSGGSGGANLRWDSTQGRMVPINPVANESVVSTKLSADAQKKIDSLEQTKTLVPSDSQAALDIDAAIQVAKDENQAVNISTAEEDQKKITNYQKRITSAQERLKKYKRKDGSYTQGAGYGRLANDIKTSKLAIEDITGSVWTEPK